MSRQDRVDLYANPRSRDNWDGRACDKSNLNKWSERASENSRLAPRARGGEMRLSDGTNGVRPRSSSRPSGDAVIEKAKSDRDHVGGTFLPSVRREA